MATYEYVGPPEIKESIQNGTGFRVQSAGDLEKFLSSRDRDELDQPFTFIVDMSGILRLAARRSEHVACAGGGTVLAAGEIEFSRQADRWMAVSVSNQSTGYCPDVESWTAVESALDHAGIQHGSGYSHPITFRRCPRPSCREWNSVKDSYFFCVFCDSPLSVTSREF
ncbi:hypothetical protein ACFWY6_13405 [Streptomyces sp. NPDC059037]|uniref:hypothetical protein n=1 Tax=Streptomyces sp. NPDC059037 TaxID=3346710 RepID=UPI003692CEEE